MCKKCSVEGCENKHYGKGYCGKHYQQFKKYGYIPERTIHDANEVVEYEDYAEIVLYNKEGNEISRALVDLNDVEPIKQYKWYLNSNGYVCNRKIGYLHRFLMNFPDDLTIDHINHNRLDNRKENLRVCTKQQNNMNKGLSKNNKSGVHGVHWDKQRNKWIAKIRVNGKYKNLGRFNSIEEAAEIRKQAEILYYGEYAPNVDEE